MNSGRRAVRIAHAYGNRRETLREALSADVDMIEADVWYRAGRIEVRHERRGWLPLLVDRRPRGVRRTGPWAVTLPRRFYLRLDASPLSVRELLAMTAGAKKLLLDVKGTKPGPAPEFAAKLTREIERAEATGWVAVCGQFWPVLPLLRDVAPAIELRYSMEREAQWDAYVQGLDRDEVPRRVCIEHRLMVAEKAALLEAKGIDVYCWTVDDAGEARRLVERGVDGVISNDLSLLARLG